MIQGDAYREHVQQVVSDPGDVIIWSEGTVHGALPWMNDHQRRVALFRFAPSTCAYGRSYMEEVRIMQGVEEQLPRQSLCSLSRYLRP